MASRSYNPGPKHPNPETVLIEGSVVGNGAASPLAANQKGRGYSVAWVSTGLYNIVFQDKFPHLLKVVPGLQMGTPAAWRAIFGTFNASTKTLPVSVFNAAGALADLTSDDRLHFSATFQNSGQPVK